MQFKNSNITITQCQKNFAGKALETHERRHIMFYKNQWNFSWNLYCIYYGTSRESSCVFHGI